MQTKNSVLDQAEQRLPAAHAEAQHAKDQIVEAMRVEIGFPVYAQAKAKLTELEHAIATTYRPFLVRVGTLAAQSKVPLPARVQGWLKEMSETAADAGNQIRSGIDGWDRLVPPLWKDGKSVDVNMRRDLVTGIRTQLQSWDGKIRNLSERRAWTEDWIEKSGWPASSPQAGPMTTTPPHHERPAAVPVEQDFSL